MSKKGFTLAEVLVTLGILGVVFAMTAPTIIAKMNGTYEEQKNTSQEYFSNNRFNNYSNTNEVDLNQYKDCSVLIINGNQIICRK